jgi:hypothetical protein
MSNLKCKLTGNRVEDPRGWEECKMGSYYLKEAQVMLEMMKILGEWIVVVIIQH